LPEDLAQLWARLAPELTRYFESHLPNASDAEDFVSKTFVRLIRRRDVTTPDNLLRVVAKALLFNEYRDNALHAPDPDARVWPGVRDRHLAFEMAIRGTEGDYAAGELSRLESSMPSYEDQLFATAHDEALRGLEVELRDAYILSELRGLTSRESGPLMGVSRTTAAARRDQATTIIREGFSA